MNLAVRKNTGLAVYSPQQGLGGFWGKIGKWANKAVQVIGGLVAGTVKSFVPIVGDAIAEYINAQAVKLGNYLEQQISTLNGLRGIEDGEITAEEEAILNEWQTLFGLFCTGLIIDIRDALTLPTDSSKLIALNAVLNKINAVNSHYLVDDIGKLSEVARQQRSYVVYTGLDSIVKTVQLSVATLGIDVEIVPVQFNINVYDFSPLFSNSIVTTVKGDNYRKKGIRIAAPIAATAQIDFANVKLPVKTPVKTVVTSPVSTPSTTPVATPVAVPTTSLPVFTIPANSSTTVTTPVATTTQVTTPVATTPVVETTTTPPTTTTTNNNSNTVREAADDSIPDPKNNKGLIIGGLLLLGAAAIALRKKKVAKKATTLTKKSK